MYSFFVLIEEDKFNSQFDLFKYEVIFSLIIETEGESEVYYRIGQEPGKSSRKSDQKEGVSSMYDGNYQEYARKMNDRVMPFRTAYAMNSAVAVEACILLIPAEIQNTMPSSARIRMMKMPLFWNTILLSSADVPTAHAVTPLTSSAKVIHQ